MAMTRRRDKLELIWRWVLFPGELVRRKRWYWQLRSSYTGDIEASGNSKGYGERSRALAAWEKTGASCGNVQIIEE